MVKVNVPADRIDVVLPNFNPVVIITTVDSGGYINAAPFALCMKINHEPPMLAFSVGLGKDTHKNVLETKEFVVNVLMEDEEILRKMLITAKRFPPRVNELEKAGLTAISAEKVTPPRIKECKAHFECRLEWTKTAGNHLIVTGTVVSASVNKEIVTRNFDLKINELRPVYYWGGRGIRRFFGIGKLYDMGREQNRILA